MAVFDNVGDVEYNGTDWSRQEAEGHFILCIWINPNVSAALQAQLECNLHAIGGSNDMQCPTAVPEGETERIIDYFDTMKERAAADRSGTKPLFAYSKVTPPGRHLECLCCPSMNKSLYITRA